MRIAILTDGIWPYVIGGMQKHSYYLCKYLIRNGVDVDLYYTDKRRGNTIDPAEQFIEEGPGRLKCIFIDFKGSCYFPGHYLYELWKYSRSVYQAILPNISSYDFVYAQGLAGWYTILHKEALKSRVPLMSNFHGLNAFQNAVNLRGRLEQVMFRPVAKAILKNADYVQSLGKALTDILLNEGVQKNRIAEFGIGIDDDWISGEPKNELSETRSFVFIGRYDRIKGVTELNSALRRLGQRNDFVFSFIGPIPEKKKIRHPGIVYHGMIASETEIKAILDKSDFLVLPSYSEGMPTVILEAMARGCAIIATNVGAVSELVSDENGMLIKPESSVSLFVAINDAIDIDGKKLLAMKSASRRIVSKFLWASVAKKMNSFFSVNSLYNSAHV